MATEQTTGPTPETNKTLSVETAHAALTMIKKAAGGATVPDHVKAISEAYATVVDAMPKPESGGVW